MTDLRDGDWREVLSRLSRLETRLEQVGADVGAAACSAAGAERQAQITNGRVSRLEDRANRHHETLYGLGAVDDRGGLLGMARQTNTLVRVLAALTTVLLVPMALVFFAVYAERL